MRGSIITVVGLCKKLKSYETCLLKLEIMKTASSKIKIYKLDNL